MSSSNDSLISVVYRPTKANDHSSKHDSPDRVVFNKDKGHHHRENRNQNKRQQKQFSKEDPHVDIQA